MGKKMIGFSRFLWVLGLLFLFVTTNSVHADREATCQDCIDNFVSDCKPYLVGETATPAVGCCLGLSNTYRGITKYETRKDICECLHKLAVRDGYKPERAKKIVKYCKIDFPVPLAPSATDCKK